MYSRGMTQRDISSTIEDIYGCKVYRERISDITDAEYIVKGFPI